MVDRVMMSKKHQKYQQKNQQQQKQPQQQQPLKCMIKSSKHKHTEKEKRGDYYKLLSTTATKSTNTNTTTQYLTSLTTTIFNCFSSCIKVKCNHYYYRHGIRGGISADGLYLWPVLVVFMLILCSNNAISQQRYINNNIKLNNSNNNNTGNILLQISTPPSLSSSSLLFVSKNNSDDIKGVGSAGGFGGSVGIIVAAEVEKQVFDDDEHEPQLIAKSNITTKTTISTTSSYSSSSSSSTSSSSSSSSSSLLSLKNLPTLDINNGNNNNTNINSHFKKNYNETLLNDGESIIASGSDSNNNNNININNKNYNNSSSEDLANSAEIFNESEDGYENFSFVSSTTSRPNRSSIAPSLSSAQERERRLMNVLAARRSALQRPGFRNRIATTGRTAAAVETTSKSPTDPRSICIRNCTKNFTRRTTASCMRQCANFSRVAAGSSAGTVVVKNSSKSGTGTAQAGERDTNEILFTDESSHGLLVIAKEQNDTLNHITDDKKAGTIAKLRGRRKQQSQMSAITLATTSIEDDEIQPYLFFGQKLPPLKPNALTITAVSDEHPKLLEVSVAEVEPVSSTTPASLTSASTLSAVERSRARFKYNMRNGVSFNRRYSTISRSTTPEVPTELRTTTLRIVAAVVKEPKEPKIKLAQFRPEFLEKFKESSTPKLSSTQVVRDEPVLSSSTPLIITVLGDEEMVTPATDTGAAFYAKQEHMKMPTTLPTTTAMKPFTTNTSLATTTTTTTTKRPTTRAIITSTVAPTSTAATTTFTTTTSLTPKVDRQPTKTTSTTSTTSTTTPEPSPEVTTKKPIISEEDTELLRKLGPSLTQPINTDDKTNLIIFVNRTTNSYRPNHHHVDSATKKPQQIMPPQAVTTDSSTRILHTTILTSIRSTVNSYGRDIHFFTTTSEPMASSQKGPVLNNGVTPTSTTLQPVITGEISSTVVTDDQEISKEMQRMNIVTMVLAGIGIVPLLAIILYLLRNYLLKTPIKDDEDFDVCITDQQPISPVKKIDSKYRNNDDDDEDEVDHHKRPPQRQHSLHNKLMSAPLTRDNNHNLALNHQRFDDKSSVASDQEFERSNIRLKSLLGEGNFGQVWKAEADDLSGHFGATRIVAVKTIKACSTQLSLKDEANIMRKLGSHQNVVTLLGACVESEPHMLIMEYAMRGRLLSLLRAARNATNILPASVPGGRSLTPLSPRTLAGFCLDIACGMEYIAEKRIVHRDLAARNVLLDHNGICKICDFGMSIDLDAERKRKELEKNCANEIMRSNFNKFKFDFGGKFIMNHWTQTPIKDGNEKKIHGQDTIGKRPALPIRWMAPEALQYNVFSTETDIWAFGIVLWEIATLGSTPYSHITGREVIRRVPQGLRPDLPKEGRHEFYNLMSRCWHKDPQMRPSFSQCRLEISRSLHKWVDDDSAASDYMDVSGFSEDLEQGMVYFNHRISEFECEI